MAEARESLRAYFDFYDTRRLHKDLGCKSPHKVYYRYPEMSKSVELDIYNYQNGKWKGKTDRSRMNLIQAFLLSKE